MRNKKWNDEKLIAAVKNNKSVAGVLKDLGICTYGSNYRAFKVNVSRLNFDISHFTGQGHLHGKRHNWGNGRPLTDLLVENSDCKSYHSLKLRLIKNNLLSNRCYICQINEWNNAPLKLQLDHINGNNTDNRIENLRLICPNCHSQTSTFAGKNIKHVSNKHIPRCEVCDTPISGAKYKRCMKCRSLCNNKKCSCGKSIRSSSKTCKDCRVQKTKIDWPELEDLRAMVDEFGFMKTGKVIGVSDNAVRKHLGNNGI
jgi:hypothetical protein